MLIVISVVSAGILKHALLAWKFRSRRSGLNIATTSDISFQSDPAPKKVRSVADVGCSLRVSRSLALGPEPWLLGIPVVHFASGPW